MTMQIRPFSPDVERRAREIAKEQGHRDLDHLIICTDGARVPVWQFYIEAAALTSAEKDATP